MNHTFDIKLPNQTAQLVETRVGLTGNYQIVVKKDQVNLEPLLKTNAVAKLIKRKLSLTSNLSWDINKFFEPLGNKSQAYNIPDFVVDKKSETPIPQYDTRQMSGIKHRRGNTGRFFAPLWVNKKIPQKFVIYKIPKAVDITSLSNNELKVTDFFDSEIIEKASIAKVIDMSDNVPLGRYLRDHVEDTSFVDSPIEIIRDQNPKFSFNGISLSSLGMVKRIDRTDFYRYARPTRIFDQLLIDKFQKHKLSSANLLNLSFEFDVEGDDFEFYRYFGLYVDEQSSNLELQADPNTYHQYNQFDQIKQIDQDIKDKIKLAESPKYYTNGVSENTQTAGNPSGNSYFGYLKTSNNKYYHYQTSLSNPNSANFDQIGNTNLDTFRYVYLNQKIDENDFFSYRYVNFDKTGEYLTSSNGTFSANDQNSYVQIPKRGTASTPQDHPQIVDVLTANRAKIEPGRIGEFLTKQSSFQIVISKSFYQGYFHPYPLREFETSMLGYSDHDFEHTYAKSSNIDLNQNLELKSFDNLYQQQGEEILLDNVFPERDWIDVNFPLEIHPLRWRSSEGTDTYNNLIPLTNSIFRSTYGGGPSSTRWDGSFKEDKTRQALYRYSHQWLFTKRAEMPNVNIGFNFNNYQPKRGELFSISLPTNANDPINDVVLMYTGYQVTDGVDTVLAFIRYDDTSINNTTVVSTLNTEVLNIIINDDLAINAEYNIFNANATDQQLHESLIGLKDMTTSTLDPYFNATSGSDYDLLIDHTTDNFDSIFNNHTDFTPSHHSKYTYLDSGNSFMPSRTWFKGYQVVAQPRTISTETPVGGLRNLPNLSNSDRYNDYRFSAILGLDSTLTDINDYKVEVIENRAHKFIVLLLKLPASYFQNNDMESIYREPTWSKYSFSWIKNLLGRYQEQRNNLKRSDVNLEYQTIMPNGDIVYDDFYLYLTESTVFSWEEDYSIEPFDAPELWPLPIQKTLQNKIDNVGTQVRIQPYNGPVQAKQPGEKFMPSLYDLWTFDRSDNNSPSFINSTIESIEMVDLPILKYGNKSHYILNQLNPQSDKNNFYQGSTFRNQSEEYDARNSNDRIYFPKIGESILDYVELNPFDMNWNFSFNREYNHSNSLKIDQSPAAKRRPGYILPNEVETPFGSKLLKLPEYVFTTTSQVYDLRLNSRNRTLDTRIDKNQLLSESMLNISDLIPTSNLNLDLIEQYYNTIDQFKREYQKLNITPHYQPVKILAGSMVNTPESGNFVVDGEETFAPSLKYSNEFNFKSLMEYNYNFQYYIRQEVDVSMNVVNDLINLSINLNQLNLDLPLITSQSSTPELQYQDPKNRRFVKTIQDRVQVNKNYDQLIELVNNQNLQFYILIIYKLKS